MSRVSMCLNGSHCVPATRARRALSDYLRSVDLTVGDFRVFGIRFPDVSGNLIPARAPGL